MAVIRPGAGRPQARGVRRGVHKTRAAYLAYLSGASEGAVDYATWIPLDLGDAIASFDSGGILNSATTAADTNITTIQVTGTGGSDSAWWVFEPRDANGTLVDLGQFGVVIFLEFEGGTQPSSGSDIGIVAGAVATPSGQPAAGTNNWHALGARWDTTNYGPDLVSARQGNFHSTGTSQAASDAKLEIRIHPPSWDGSKYEQDYGGGCEWLIPDGDHLEAQRVRGIFSPTANMGTDTSQNRVIFGVYEGIQARQTKFKAYYRVFPYIGDTP